MKICSHLKPILDYELKIGNQIEESSMNWSSASYVIDLKMRITFNQLEILNDYVNYWENLDNHYKIQKGFYCNKCKHSIAGPL